MAAQTNNASNRDGVAEFVPEDSQSVPRAPEGMRYIGFCRACRDFVELGPTFACMGGGHSKDQIAVALLVGKDEPRPHMPKLNLGALFMPALWGPAHGQWFMILFYPLWLLLDNLIFGAVHGSSAWWLAVLASAAAAFFTVYYALYANRHGYLRVAAEKTPEEYIRRERVLSIVFIVIGLAFLGFATWYNLAMRTVG